ncbi:MAG: GNAT family N-acetyltransferase [Christensenellales bacterium]
MVDFFIIFWYNLFKKVLDKSESAEVIVVLFKPSKSMKVTVLPEQEKQLSSKESIASACLKENVLAYDIYLQDLLIGFVMVRKFDEGSYFLWNYAIDCKYQNQNYGTAALRAFIRFMKDTYNMLEMTTTYIYGNEHAKHIYEKIGFVETDIVDEVDCHEVNMVYDCR